MCGIAGFVGEGSDHDLISMADDIVHRGPDGRGLYSDKSKAVFLAHQRLSVVDIEGGHQPMRDSNDEVILVFNGEIYNCLSLRNSLTADGYKFKTSHSDTEVILNGYKKWGTDIPKYLNGMFAFVIYDRLNHQIFMARDRFGEKPLYYYFDHKNLIFSSELGSVTKHTVVSPELDSLAVQKYFAYGYVPAPLTIYKNCYKLKPGHSISYDLHNKKIISNEYWKFRLEPDLSLTDEGRVIEELDYLIENAVKSRLMSDVPLGLFLSGGIDSSAILAYTCKSMDKSKIKTFTIGFNENSFDESEYANNIAEYFEVENLQKKLYLNDAKNLCPAILSRLDEPVGDASIIPTYFLSEYTRQYVKVALSGDGGDELFAGYDPFNALKLAEIYKKIVPKLLHKGVVRLAEMLPISRSNMSFDFKVKRALKGLSYNEQLWNPVWLAPSDPGEINELFNKAVRTDELYSEAIEVWNERNNLDMIDKTLEFYTKFYMPGNILTKVDRASMMNSLESRAVFLDKDLAEFCMRLPNHFKYKNGTKKYILKKLLQKKVPKDVLERKKKGFGLPVSKWLMDFPEEIPMRKVMGMDMRQVEKLWSMHRESKQDNRLFMWNWYVLQQFIG